MSAIDEMYEKYGFGKRPMITDGIYPEIYLSYPPFTAENQLELIKLIGKTLTSTECSDRLWDILWRNDFEEALASRVNLLYQDLTPAQRQEVKEILER